MLQKSELRLMIVSIHTPVRARQVTGVITNQTPPVSIHTPVRARRSDPSMVVLIGKVSIHTPVRARRPPQKTLLSTRKFQSTRP